MIKFITLLLVFTSCSSVKPDYLSKETNIKKAIVNLYWPRQWQSQWGKYKLYINNKPQVILKNEGYFGTYTNPGVVEIKTHHVQDEKFINIIKLKAQTGRQYFLKLDTQSEKVTIASAIGDITSTITIVDGDKEQAKTDNKPLGHHVIIQVDSKVAKSELLTCCSSKNIIKIKTQ